MSELERRDSRKRRRLSERRRVFGRLGLGSEERLSSGACADSKHSDWSGSSGFGTGTEEQQAQASSTSRSDSPLADNTKISMKIQFHITVAPDNEPLILDTSQLQQPAPITPQTPPSPPSPVGAPGAFPKASESSSLGQQIHQKLMRQNSASTRRRQHLIHMHNQSALLTAKPAAGGLRAHEASNQADESDAAQSEDNIMARAGEQLHSAAAAMDELSPASSNLTRNSGARSSTISSGFTDEATMRFLRQHQTRQTTGQGGRASPLGRGSLQLQVSARNQLVQRLQPREHIYFKRDGQRFGHEFTLKLAVDRTYRCLIKVRPLIPLQGISIQGHQVLFVDCSQTSSGAPLPGSESSSAPASALTSSSSALNRSWQNIQQTNHRKHATNHHHNHRLSYAQTAQLGRSMAHSAADLSANLYQQQQNQMLRYFAASHCSSSSNPHLGGQLIYMFDWSGARFEVNKNKARTQVQTVLKFKNGQILSLPLQVKFYQPECKQHLNWGSQLHFIDYDCNINNMGQMSVDRIQYY